MNRKQLQIEVCKALLDVNSRIAASELNENEIAVTTTGFDAVVFDKDEIIFDVSKIKKIETLKGVLAEHEKDEPVKPTGEMFKDSNRTIERLEGENIITFADVSIMKKFDGFQYTANSARGRILVKDEFGRLVGCFLPTTQREVAKYE